MLYRWLPKDEVVNIPPFAHTMVGVGALVINERNQVLVVSEMHALIAGSWKLPGGYVEPSTYSESITRLAQNTHFNPFTALLPYFGRRKLH